MAREHDRPRGMRRNWVSEVPSAEQGILGELCFYITKSAITDCFVGTWSGRVPLMASCMYGMGFSLLLL
jgi:hypothetical protein